MRHSHWLIGSLLIGACDLDSTDPPGEVIDAQVHDAAPIADAALLADAPVADAASLDASSPDARPPDASPADAAPPLPDLQLIASQIQGSLSISQEQFEPDHCAVSECLDGAGLRRLLRFDTPSVNHGEADLVLGAPTPGGPQWQYDACHQHWHYKDYAHYELVGPEGVVASGKKRSFCLRDDVGVVPGAPSSGYDCNNQGLSVGWADVYAAALDCQWIDITGVAPATYTLRITVNPSGAITESDYANNVVEIPVTLPP